MMMMISMSSEVRHFSPVRFASSLEMHNLFPNPDCRPWNGNASTPVFPSQTVSPSGYERHFRQLDSAPAMLAGD